MAMVPADALEACDTATLRGVFLKSSRLDSEVCRGGAAGAVLLLKPQGCCACACECVCTRASACMRPHMCVRVCVRGDSAGGGTVLVHDDCTQT